MHPHLSRVSFFVLGSLLAACSRPASHVSEAPDSFNSLSTFNIAKVFTYNDLLQNEKIQLPNLPWTDTYWPLDRQGLADRWTNPIDRDPLAALEEVKIASFMVRFGLETAKSTPDPQLSPAEKYDMLFQYRHKLAVPADKMLAFTAQLGLKDLAVRTKTGFAGKRAALHDMYDFLLSPDNLDLGQAMSMSFNGWTSYLKGSLDEGNRYLSRSDVPGADWAWEGHCHGWAPAAVMTRPPAHGVMAVAGDKQIFFSEADLRGLMTKAWADSSPDRGSYFLGRRCYQGDDPDGAVSSNSRGRGYEGTLQVAEGGAVTSFTVEDSLADLTRVKVDNRTVSLNVYQIRLAGSGDKKWLLEHYRSGDDSTPNEYWIANTFGDLSRNTSSDDPLKNLVKPFKAQLSGCWDTNPASFHQVLIEQIARRQTGLVMDRTRTSQVWNQPIYDAAFDIGPLRSVGKVDDAFAKFHAANTAFVAEVTAYVRWTAEPDSLALSYAPSFDEDSLSQTDYNYVLEFDAQGRVLGGEWGTLRGANPKAFVPDFLFGYKKGQEPLDNFADKTDFDTASIDYSGIIGKLHACSLDQTIDGQTQLLGQTLPYKKCVIEKLP